MKKYRPVCGDKPCNDCPFRRKARAGWLGASDPEGFIVSISLEQPLPCHPTIDYTDLEWQAKWEAQQIGKTCAGSLIMATNMCKTPRDPKFPRLPADRELVFANHREFIDHHKAAPVRSWETAESYELRSPVDERVAHIREALGCTHPEHRRGTRGGLRSNQEVCMNCGDVVLKRKR